MRICLINNYLHIFTAEYVAKCSSSLKLQVRHADYVFFF